MASRDDGPPITSTQPPTPAQHGSHAPHGYEETDVEASPVVISGVVLLALTAVVTLAMSLFLGVMTMAWKQDGPKPRDSAPEQVPGPDSAAYPIEDWRSVHTQQLDRIEGIGWVDKQRGVAHIPIERAMQLALEKLPVRPGLSPSPSPSPAPSASPSPAPSPSPSPSPSTGGPR